MKQGFEESPGDGSAEQMPDSTSELARSQAELKAIYDASPVMLCVVDARRKVLFANPAFTDFTGIPENELVGGSACGVFGCINALEDPRGCGFGANCSDCSLLAAIQDTLRTGKGHQNIEYSTTIARESGNRDAYMLGSMALIESFGEPRLLLCLNDVTDRKIAELKIQGLLREKAILLKESHHRIKNNMGMVKSLLNLQALQEKEGACRNALDTAAGRVHSMMLLYDKLYQAEHQHELSIRALLEPLVTELLSMFDHAPPVSTDITIEDFAVRAPLLSPLAIIVNELITNAIKHAFKSVPDPRISLSVVKDGSKVLMEYRDNGPGLHATNDGNGKTGFGMQLIELLVEQINGTVEFKRNGDTRYSIRFDV